MPADSVGGKVEIAEKYVALIFAPVATGHLLNIMENC